MEKRNVILGAYAEVGQCNMNVLQTKHILLTRERCGKKIST